MLNEGEASKKKAPRKTTASDSATNATRSTPRRKKAAAPVAAPATPEPIVVARKVEPLPPEPTHEEIARKAFELYLARGRQEGRAADDWMRAEVELRKERKRGPVTK